MADWTPALAVVGAVSGVASLAWNVASHFLSGGRLTVDLLGGWVREAADPPLRILVEPFEDNATLYMDAAGPAHAILAIRAVNTGRQPVTVSDWRLEFGPNSMRTGSPTHEGDSPLPAVLGPGQTAWWYVDVIEFLTTAEVNEKHGGSASPVRAIVRHGASQETRSAALPMPWRDLGPYFGLERTD